MKKIFLIAILSIVMFSCKLPTPYEKLPDNSINVTEISLVDTTTGVEKILTSDRKFICYANFLPSGDKIIFAQYSNPNSTSFSAQCDIYTMNLDGSNRVAIVERVGFKNQVFRFIGKQEYLLQNILFTPDKKKIIFASTVSISSGLDKGIYSVNFDGSGLTKIYTYVDEDIQFISLSKDGSEIAFSGLDLKNKKYSLGVINVLSGTKKVLKYYDSTRVLFPQFVPKNDSTIVYFLLTGDFNKPHQINTISINDTTQITTIAKTKDNLLFFPYISSDGRMLFQDYDNFSMLSIIDLNTKQKIGFALPFYANTFRFSSDDKLILCTSGVDIFISNKNGAGYRNVVLTQSKQDGVIGDACFSFDNKSLLLLRNK